MLLGGDTYATCSVVFPLLAHLLKHCNVKDEDAAYIVRFKNRASEVLQDMYDRLLSKDCMVIATCLDPRFKKLKCLPKENRSGAWEKLAAQVTPVSTATSSEQSAPPRKKPKLLCYESSSGSEPEDNDALQPRSVEAILSRYKAEQCIDEDADPLQWWLTHQGAHPELATLAKKYLGIIPTSVPSERVFSLAGYIVNKTRASLLPENVNQLICLSNWLKGADRAVGT